MDTMDQRKSDSQAPAFLYDDQKFKDETEKDYELRNPEDVKAKNRLAKLKELEK